MPSNKRKRLEQIEQRAYAGKKVIAVVDVRGMAPEEEAAFLDAKRSELNTAKASATLIIIREDESHDERT